MSLRNDINDELSLLRSLEEQAKNQYKYIQKLRTEKTNRICKSAMFDEYILVLIAKLMSLYENEEYKLFLYQSENISNINSSSDFNDYFIGLASEENLNSFINQNEYDLADFFNNKQGFEIIYKKCVMLDPDKSLGKQIVSKYTYDEKREIKLPVSFKFLLMEFNVHSEFPYLSSIYDFEEFKYVQNFIRLLFERQYENYGEMLSVNEMNNAFDNYLSLSQKKDKTMH